MNAREDGKRMAPQARFPYASAMCERMETTTEIGRGIMSETHPQVHTLQSATDLTDGTSKVISSIAIAEIVRLPNGLDR